MRAGERVAQGVADLAHGAAARLVHHQQPGRVAAVEGDGERRAGLDRPPPGRAAGERGLGHRQQQPGQREGAEQRGEGAQVAQGVEAGQDAAERLQRVEFGSLAAQRKLG